MGIKLGHSLNLPGCPSSEWLFSPRKKVILEGKPTYENHLFKWFCITIPSLVGLICNAKGPPMPFSFQHLILMFLQVDTNSNLIPNKKKTTTPKKTLNILQFSVVPFMGRRLVIKSFNSNGNSASTSTKDAAASKKRKRRQWRNIRSPEIRKVFLRDSRDVYET